jgi:hypothetical protein
MILVFSFFLLLDQKEAKLKAERCFCALASTLARRSAGPWLFCWLLFVPLSLPKGIEY